LKKKLNIYFAGSIRGGRDDADLYLKIINELNGYGTVLTEHIGDDNLRDSGEQDLSDKEIHDRDMDWIKASDIVIAEVTSPSLGVGYEIASAISLGKPIFCFFNSSRGTSLSAMIRGSNKLEVIDYEDSEEIINALQKIFDGNVI